MVLAMVVVLQLGAADFEVDGKAAPAAVTDEQREALRFHGAIHFAVTGAYSGFAIGGGPGFSAELGATFADRFALSLRGTLGTIFVASNLMAGVGFDLALSDRFSLGFAPSIAFLGGIVFITDTPQSLTFFLPVRLSYLTVARADHEVARKGLVWFLEVGAGYGLKMSAGFVKPPPPEPSPLSVMASIGVGYSVW